MKSLPISPIIIVGIFVFELTIRGIMEASATLNPLVLKTLKKANFMTVLSIYKEIYCVIS